jgi:hypothetical protein
MHTMLAKRYKVPLTSARDALYDLVLGPGSQQLLSATLGVTRPDLLQDDLHPTTLGSKLYGRGLATFAVRQQLAAEFAALAAGKTVKPQVSTLPLPRAVSPLAAQSADLSSFCREGAAFQSLVDAKVAAVQGWQQSVIAETKGCCDLPNCRHMGYLGHGDRSQITFQINTEAVLADAYAASSKHQVKVACDLPDACSSRRQESWQGTRRMCQRLHLRSNDA